MVKWNRGALVGWCVLWVLVSVPAAADPGDEWWDEAWPWV